MQLLQLLLIRLNCATLVEVNEAIFAHPDVGLIEAIACSFGEAREEKILRAISAELEVPFLSFAEIEIEDDILAEKPLKLEPLVSKHRALPLGWSNDAGVRKLKIAMADPLDQEAIDAFSALYGAPLVVFLAQERVIKQEFAKFSAALTIAGRKEVQASQGADISAALQFVEDPEVRKAIQQVMATAVKHGAESVIIALDQAFTSAVFNFDDKRSLVVDISVSTLSFLAGLLRRGQITERKSLSFEALSRVDFKSSSVFCSVEVIRGDAAGSWKKLVLTEFSIERPDDPNFWLSVAEQTTFEIRKLFRNQTGVFLVTSASDTARSLAIKSIWQSYPDLNVVDLVGELSAESQLIAEAKNCRVLIGCQESEVLETVSRVIALPDQSRELIRGVIAVCQLPRVCECCAESFNPEEAELEKLSSEFMLVEQNFRRGKGCAVCTNGFLGAITLASVLDAETEAGRIMSDGGTLGGVTSALAESGFRSLGDEALNAAASGKTSLEFALALQNRTSNGGKAAKKEQKLQIGKGVMERRPLGGDKASLCEGRPTTETHPISGRDVFGKVMRRSEMTQERPKLPEDGEVLPVSVRKRERRPGGALLLIIDDDADQRTILRKVFELAGYAVEVAADGIDGIVSANRLQPDLIIVDFMMPDLDGRETIRRLKKGPTTGDIPVVALTAYANPDVEYGLLKAGADDFCAKSVSKKVLLKRIERLLGDDKG